VHTPPRKWYRFEGDLLAGFLYLLRFIYSVA